ncbi:MAG: maleylpyruvate isomerase family mycothiol-dependent enzyme [Actinophytocola sp.]|uniref:maleylpyruvate isomerase family mycothiol-dependent enzyme n=1 Tax=Actinophytocola sp. TaxID=1872138 RepID=UPI001322BA2D|nr:maleylpyruvate isomerase family mycothiol-dependent enzyme [Actinophytocola sp.]MPZ80736.1 maleylpyruvate isomerase family mycothiol-dependent enzyme [Actinophytocola sp.]
MDESRFLECLEADYRRLREVAPGALGEKVPSCPGWTTADLAGHVAEVYLHKTETMRLGDWPQPWPPDLGDDPLAALDRAYRELTWELSTRKPDEHALTWYAPVQTVGWWARRMAQETVIHRVDAELAAGLTPTAIPADLAADGIDEVLVCFLAYASTEYPEALGEHLDSCDGSTVRIDTPSASWLVQLGPGVVTVERGEADVEAIVRGSEDAVLRWLWRRVGNSAVELDGNHGVVGKLRQLLGDTTQ